MYGLSFIAGLSVLQRIGSMQEGKASFTLSGDYYNRELSGEVITVGPGPPVGTLRIVKKSPSVCKSVRPTVQITFITSLESFYRKIYIS